MRTPPAAHQAAHPWPAGTSDPAAPARTPTRPPSQPWTRWTARPMAAPPRTVPGRPGFYDPPDRPAGGATGGDIGGRAARRHGCRPGTSSASSPTSRPSRGPRTRWKPRSTAPCACFRRRTDSRSSSRRTGPGMRSAPSPTRKRLTSTCSASWPPRPSAAAAGPRVTVADPHDGLAWQPGIGMPGWLRRRLAHRPRAAGSQATAASRHTRPEQGLHTWVAAAKLPCGQMVEEFRPHIDSGGYRAIAGGADGPPLPKQPRRRFQLRPAEPPDRTARGGARCRQDGQAAQWCHDHRSASPERVAPVCQS